MCVYVLRGRSPGGKLYLSVASSLNLLKLVPHEPVSGFVYILVLASASGMGMAMYNFLFAATVC